MPLSTFEVHSRALPCCTLARKVSQKLVLCIPVLLSSEFCMVLEGPKNCPLYEIARCPYLGVFLSIVLMVLQSGQRQVAT